MEIFNELWLGVKTIYYFYFMSIYGIIDLFLPTKYVTFFTGMIVNFIPVAFFMKDIIGMTFFEIIYKHYGTWIYVLIVNWIWLTFLDIRGIQFFLNDAANIASLMIVTGFAVYGPMQVRGRIYIIKKGVEGSNK